MGHAARPQFFLSIVNELAKFIAKVLSFLRGTAFEGKRVTAEFICVNEPANNTMELKVRVNVDGAFGFEAKNQILALEELWRRVPREKETG